MARSSSDRRSCDRNGALLLAVALWTTACGDNPTTVAVTPDAAVVCTSNADCKDEELADCRPRTCKNNQCVPGPIPDDGLLCTEEICTAGGLVHVANHGRCRPDEICDPAQGGCVSSPPPPPPQPPTTGPVCPSSGDGFDCTREVESGGSCVSVPDDGRCYMYVAVCRPALGLGFLPVTGCHATCATDADCKLPQCGGQAWCAVDQVCRYSPPPGTDDGVSCTLPVCDTATNTIVQKPIDGLCNPDRCDKRYCHPQYGCQSNPVTCGLGEACTPSCGCRPTCGVGGLCGTGTCVAGFCHECATDVDCPGTTCDQLCGRCQ